MKNFVYFFVAVLILSCSTENKKGIIFEKEETLEDVLEIAEKQNKIVFLDCYTSWCGPCKRLSKDVFTQKEVGDLFNKNFVCAKFDMEKDGGKDIALRYNITAYPTLIFLDSKGDVKRRVVGAPDAEELIQNAKLFTHKKESLVRLQKEIDNKNYDPVIIDQFLSVYPDYPTKVILFNDYFNNISDEEKLSLDTWSLIQSHVTDLESELAVFFIKNRAKFKQKFDKKSVRELANKLFLETVHKCAESGKPLEKYIELDSKLTTQAIAFVDLQEAFLDFSTDETTSNWNNYFNQIESYYNKFDCDSRELNNTAWTIYENNEKYGSKKQLEFAHLLVKKALVDDPENHYILDTYAHVSYALGDKKEAIIKEKKAVKLATKEKNKHLQDYKDALKKFQQ